MTPQQEKREALGLVAAILIAGVVLYFFNPMTVFDWQEKRFWKARYREGYSTPFDQEFDKEAGIKPRQSKP